MKLHGGLIAGKLYMINGEPGAGKTTLALHYLMQGVREGDKVELHETTKRILEAVERVKPRRMVLDSLSELRLLAQSLLRYRRQVLALNQFLAARNCTALFLDDRTTESIDT